MQLRYIFVDILLPLFFCMSNMYEVIIIRNLKLVLVGLLA